MLESINIPVAGWFMDSRIPDIARALHLMSDGRLTLSVRCNRKTGQAQCYDLFERDGLGQEHWVTRFGLHEVDRIIPDVRRSDRQAPGHVPVGQTMKAHNEAKYQAAIDEGVELTYEFADRVEGVKRDMSGQKDFHGQAGWDGPDSDTVS